MYLVKTYCICRSFFSKCFFPKRTIAFKISAIYKFLKQYVALAAGIDKTQTLHIARHTFASLAGGSVDI